MTDKEELDRRVYPLSAAYLYVQLEFLVFTLFPGAAGLPFKVIDMLMNPSLSVRFRSGRTHLILVCIVNLPRAPLMVVSCLPLISVLKCTISSPTFLHRVRPPSLFPQSSGTLIRCLESNRRSYYHRNSPQSVKAYFFVAVAPQTQRVAGKNGCLQRFERAPSIKWLDISLSATAIRLPSPVIYREDTALQNY